MSDVQDGLWEVEEALWKEGESAYRRAVDPDCLMVFPAPAGILTPQAVLEAVAASPRWADVVMVERRIAEPAPGLCVLAYRARAARWGSPVYEAYCSSSYRLTEAGWKLQHHQQTPID